ncbi:unnamed protein product [Effrenium voratum]|nr:unnamed protein product [Effrenium voratum]
MSDPNRVLEPLGDVLPIVLRRLDVRTLAAASTVCRSWSESSETSWQQVFRLKWQDSMFELRQVRPSWRLSCSSRAMARRADLQVVAGTWHLMGTVRDSKGEMSTEAYCFFASGSLTMQGEAVHRRQDSNGHRVILHGNWQGNLCADIVALGGKRKWCLAWKEKIQEVPGAYHYAGQFEEGDGQAVVRGEFRWLGRVRGTFDYVMERFCDCQSDKMRHQQTVARRRC